MTKLPFFYQHCFSNIQDTETICATMKKIDSISAILSTSAHSKIGMKVEFQLYKQKHVVTFKIFEHIMSDLLYAV